MDAVDLQKIIDEHRMWLSGRPGGIRADLSSANLSGADLSTADLSDANLRGANLSGSDLSDAELSYSDLGNSDLSNANLCRAVLSSTNLLGTNLCSANLSNTKLNDVKLIGVNLRDVDLSVADLNNVDLRYANLSDVKTIPAEALATFTVCPEEGSFEAWKKCRNNVLVKLLIPETAKRSSATTRKCRASHAVVLEVTKGEYGVSVRDKTFFYKVGETVYCDSWDDNRWKECSGGIHFFMTRDEAALYTY